MEDGEGEGLGKSTESILQDRSVRVLLTLEQREGPRGAELPTWGGCEGGDKWQLQGEGRWVGYDAAGN